MVRQRCTLPLIFGLFFVCTASFSQIKKTAESSCIKKKIDSLYEESIHLYNTNQTGLAIKTTIEALDISHNENFESSLATFYILLGNLYLSSKDNEKAKMSFQKGLDYALKLKDTVSIYKSYNSLGNFMSDVDRKPREALGYYNKAIHLMEKVRDTSSLVAALINVGWTHLDFNENNRAYHYLENAKYLNDKLHHKKVNIEADILHLLGRYYYQEKDYDAAITYLNRSLKLSKKHHLFYIITDVYNLRSKVFKHTNQVTRAYNDLRSYSIYNDSLLSLQRTEDIEAANAKFAVAEYERDLEIAKKERHLSEIRADSNRRKLLFAIVTSLFLLGLGYLYFSNKSRKRDNAVLIEKNKLLQDAKEKSDHLNALKTQFISTVSHELRTPLYGIIGISNLLDEGRSNFNDEQIELIASLKESSDFLLKHINDVLKIGEIESRHLSFHPETINFKTFITNLKEKVNVLAQENNNTLHVVLDANIPDYVFVDELRLNELLINLLDNACKFTSNGNVWFRMKQKDKSNSAQTLLFEIQDDGIGISDDKRDIIFDRFYQANRGHKNLDGTGLGLSIVRYLLHSLDSEIQLESTLGEGTLFYFELVIPLTTGTVKASPKHNQDSKSFKKKHILIAEDNKISQSITKKMVESLGHDCVACDNGLETYKVAKTYDFDLVLMDLNMPVMDGMEATKRILEYNNTIPIVALTALDLSNIIKDCYAAGMLCAVNKPINKGVLNAIIEKYSAKDISV